MNRGTTENDIERRVIAVGDLPELRVEDGEKGAKIVGYAAVFNRASVDLGGFTEEIAPGAFAGVIGDDVRALVDHDPSRIIGRNKAGTLRLAEDEQGLRMEIDVAPTTVGADILASVKRGDVTGSSFAFRTLEDSWRTKDGKPHRTIVKLKRLYDVGPVSYPAYPDTSVAVRSLAAFRGDTDSARDEQFRRNQNRQRHAAAL